MVGVFSGRLFRWTSGSFKNTGLMRTLVEGQVRTREVSSALWYSFFNLQSGSSTLFPWPIGSLYSGLLTQLNPNVFFFKKKKKSDVRDDAISLYALNLKGRGRDRQISVKSKASLFYIFSSRLKIYIVTSYLKAHV